MLSLCTLQTFITFQTNIPFISQILLILISPSWQDIFAYLASESKTNSSILSECILVVVTLAVVMLLWILLRVWERVKFEINHHVIRNKDLIIYRKSSEVLETFIYRKTLHKNGVLQTIITMLNISQTSEFWLMIK